MFFSPLVFIIIVIFSVVVSSSFASSSFSTSFPSYSAAHRHRGRFRPHHNYHQQQLCRRMIPDAAEIDAETRMRPKRRKTTVMGMEYGVGGKWGIRGMNGWIEEQMDGAGRSSSPEKKKPKTRRPLARTRGSWLREGRERAGPWCSPCQLADIGMRGPLLTHRQREEAGIRWTLTRRCGALQLPVPPSLPSLSPLHHSPTPPLLSLPPKRCSEARARRFPSFASAHRSVTNLL